MVDQYRDMLRHRACRLCIKSIPVILGSNRDMKLLLRQTALFLSVALFFVSCTKTYTKEEINRLFQPITSRYGIKIVYEIGEDFGPILIGGGRLYFKKAEPIDINVLIQYSSLLKRSLEKYPIQVIKEYLSAIYFAKELDCNGVQYSGTYYPFRRIVYLVNDGKQSDELSIGTFHHEFSSILLKRHTFFLNPWFDQNPDDFRYLYDIYGNLHAMMQKKINVTQVGTENDYEKGFMNTYAQTNFENDFNEYARMILSQPQKFKRIMKQYKRVRGKFLLLLEFYHKIDPIFTEEYLLGEN